MDDEEEPFAPSAGKLMATADERRRQRLLVVGDFLLRGMEASIC